MKDKTGKMFRSPYSEQEVNNKLRVLFGDNITLRTQMANLIAGVREYEQNKKIIIKEKLDYEKQTGSNSKKLKG